MNLPTRHMLLGMTLGALCATVLAATGPGLVVPALAEDVTPKPAFDTADLVRFEGKRYRVENEDWIATDPVFTSRIKKVEGGRVSYVSVTQTETGTYSTDAMFSRHVQYPGISVEEVPGWRPSNHFYWWSNGRWGSFVSAVNNSFFHLRTGATSITQWGDITCVGGKNFRVC